MTESERGSLYNQGKRLRYIDHRALTTESLAGGIVAMLDKILSIGESDCFSL